MNAYKPLNCTFEQNLEGIKRKKECECPSSAYEESMFVENLLGLFEEEQGDQCGRSRVSGLVVDEISWLLYGHQVQIGGAR